MERLSGCCEAKAGREKVKKKSKPAAVSDFFVMEEYVSLLWDSIVFTSIQVLLVFGRTCIEVYL